MLYLDDGLGAAADMDKAKILVCNYMQILLKSGIGFLPNEAKCVWEPTQVITWLGAIFNTSTSEISATVKRITSLQEDLAALLAISSSCLPALKFAFVCGKIISLRSCVGDLSRLMSSNLFLVINTAPTWNSYVRLSSESLAGLNFRKPNVASLNDIPIWPVRRKPSRIVYSDASGSACGSFIEFEGKMFHQNRSDFKKTSKFYIQRTVTCFLINESLRGVFESPDSHVAY